MQFKVFYKAIFAVLVLLAVSGCRQLEEQYIFESEQVVPLPDGILVFMFDHETDTLKPVMALERVSPNQFRNIKGDPFFTSWAKMPNREGFWIVQSNTDENSKFEYYLVKLEDGVFREFSQEILPEFGLPRTPKSEITSFDGLFSYFDRVLDLGLEFLDETDLYYFDMTQQNLTDEVLENFVNISNLDYRERKDAGVVLREQGLQARTAVREAERTAADQEAERLEIQNTGNWILSIENNLMGDGVDTSIAGQATRFSGSSEGAIILFTCRDEEPLVDIVWSEPVEIFSIKESGTSYATVETKIGDGNIYKYVWVLSSDGVRTVGMRDSLERQRDRDFGNIVLLLARLIYEWSGDSYGRIMSGHPADQLVIRAKNTAGQDMTSVFDLAGFDNAWKHFKSACD